MCCTWKQIMEPFAFFPFHAILHKQNECIDTIRKARIGFSPENWSHLNPTPSLHKTLFRPLQFQGT